MEQPQFVRHADCRRCPRWETCHHPGMAATAEYPEAAGHSRALLIVGEAPGRDEDFAGRPFVGRSGQYLRKLYVEVLNLQLLADIYFTNALRCRPPGNDTPTPGQLNHCKDHLLDDIRQLQACYGEVVILCVGASAARSILSSNLQETFTRQGGEQPWGWAGTQDLRPCRVYTTYHPAMLLTRRDPSKLAAVRDHLRLLEQYLSGTQSAPNELPAWKLCDDLPSYPIDRLSLDIETYGKCSQYPEQTCFHPARMKHWDKPREIILTVALAWRDPVGNLRATAFDFRNLRHRQRLESYVRQARTLIGANIKFDLMCLRGVDPRFRMSLAPGKPLVDVGVLNYLHSEQRPEKSLKSLTRLHGTALYSETERQGSYRYSTPDHAQLYQYNVKDAVATLLEVEHLESLIRKDYPDSDKLSDYSRQWYSDLIWTCLEMEESGIAFDLQALDELDTSLVFKMALMESECRHRYNLLLRGKGSGKSLQNLYDEAVQAADLLGDPRIITTDKKKDISCNAENANLLLEELPLDSFLREQLHKQQQYESWAKTVTSYTRPMLHGTEANPAGSRVLPDTSPGHRSNIGLAYPSWYITPFHAESGQAGGTIQGRITSKGPACQTLPAIVQQALTSRYTDGFLLNVDLSQIELRVGALLSGDPLMIEEYRRGVDRHTDTGRDLLKILKGYLLGRSGLEIAHNWITAEELDLWLTSDNPRQYKLFDLFRQAGKTSNFLIQFRGQGKKLHFTLIKDLGADIPIEVCQALINSRYDQYPRFVAWQNELLDTAARYGRLELPLTGQSRMFLGTRRSIEATYMAEVCNFPIQTTAANTMLDFQRKLHAALAKLPRRYGKVHVGLNVYDAVKIDGPGPLLPRVQAIVREVFASSDYWNRLQDLLARTIPLAYDAKILVSPDRQRKVA